MDKVSVATGDGRLTTREQWSQQWAPGTQAQRQSLMPLNVRSPQFRDIHELFTRLLPRDSSFRFLEVGAYPGTYMRYFHQHFQYQVSGMEYVDWCCTEAQHLLDSCGISAEMIHDDIFNYELAPGQEPWDVVASFGLVEHFEDPTEVIARHLALLREGGYLVLTIPNHAGLNGLILKHVNRHIYDIHNRMSYKRLASCVARTELADIVAGGYRSRLGFWNSGIYERLKLLGRTPYLMVRSLTWGLERIGRILPDSRLLSPNSVIIAQKRGQLSTTRVAA